MTLPFNPTGPSFWRDLKCQCGDKGAFVVWGRAACGDCYRALLVVHGGKLPWKESP